MSKSRIRTVKPELALHEGLFDLEEETNLPIRYLWAMLPTICDREGRFEWRPRQLKALLAPYDDFNFEEALNAFVGAGFIERYEVDGQPLAHIPTFSKHQRVNSREAASDLPSPPTETPAHARTCTHMQDEEEGKGREGKGKEEKNARGFEEIHEETLRTIGLQSFPNEEHLEYLEKLRTENQVEASAEDLAAGFASHAVRRGTIITGITGDLRLWVAGRKEIEGKHSRDGPSKPAWAKEQDEAQDAVRRFMNG